MNPSFGIFIVSFPSLTKNKTKKLKDVKPYSFVISSIQLVLCGWFVVPKQLIDTSPDQKKKNKLPKKELFKLAMTSKTID